MSFETAMKIPVSSGGGMGGLREVDKEASGIFAVSGMEYGYIATMDSEKKGNCYKTIQNLAVKF